VNLPRPLSSRAAGIDVHLVKPAEPAEVRRLLAEAGEFIN
jgi:hypothetical protein